MQLALWFAGLRGAMSFALVEHIPLYDAETGEGTRLKPELKAMTSASIMFTVFILGGTTFYIMEYLGVSPQSNTFRKHTSPPPQELAGLLAQNRRQNAATKATNTDASPETLLSGNQTTFRRARHLKT
jgi:NhaP-type Na+/H+ or K+/H+ antiporter